jgi:glucose-1-phosphate thymidylyltransferase
VVIGDGCEIGPGVTIFPYTSIGNNVVIESFTQIRNCVIGNSVRVGSHTHISDSIIAEGTSVGPRFTAPSARIPARTDGDSATVQMGCVIAEDVDVGADVSIRAGTLVGHGARVREMNAVREDVPELSYVV